MPKLFSARYSVLVFLCLYVAVANAQDNVPTHPVDGTFIKEWLVLGPFFPEDLETDFLASANGEAFVNPKPGDTLTTDDGETLTWLVYRPQGNIVNLQHAIGKHEQAVCYAFCLLESNGDGDEEILVGSDDGVVVFLNGQRVHTYLVGRSVIVDDDRVAVSLRPGKNRCLVKISNGIQDWRLTMRVFPPTRAVIAGVITDKAGKTLSNAIVRLWQGSTLIAKTETDSKGSYQFSAYPASGHYDIEATHGTKGNWEIGVQLSAGARVNMNLMLQNAVSVTGHLLAFDDSAHPGVLVEASLLGEDGTSRRRVTTFSDKKGRYAFINLIAGLYQLRCYSPGTDSDNPNTIVSVGAEKTLENVDFRFPPFKQGIWENYTYLDGLANNHVRAIHQDREGFLWFGTDGGVSRYDGDKFVNFTTDDGLANNSVLAVYQDREGFLWFGTWGGVSRYDGKAFVNFTTDDGLASNFVMVIHQDREGHFWFGTWDGRVSRYDGDKFVNFTTDDGLANNSVLAIYQDREGFLWFGTNNGGISRYDGRELVNFTTANDLASDSVWAIHQDREGFLWFGTLGGVSRYNGNAFVNFTINDGLADNFVRAIHQDREGFLWFGTNNGGVSRYNGNAFVNFTTNNGLASNSVSVIHQSREGFLWFGTDGGGVSQYNGSEFVSFTTADGLQNNSVYSILQDQEGFLWFGTDGGVSQYNGSEFVSFTTANGLASDFVRVIHQDREGFLWFGALGGVSRYDGKVFVNFSTHDGLANNVVPAIHQDREGFLWFGTLGGISRYDGKAFVNFTTDEGLAYNAVLTIHQDREGSLWFGTSRGVSRYDGKAFVNFSTHDGLANNFVRMIRQDREGFLWFGTSGGVFRYDGKAFVNFSAEDGLAQNDVTPIYQDREGALWFGTDGGGVSRYDGTSWTSLDTRDGLINNRVWGICQDSDETLWFGTSEGVTQYRPNQVSPSVRIVSVQSHNTSAQAGPLETIKNITTNTRVTIKYSSIDFKTVKEKRQYQVRIKEIDSDWRKPTLSDTLNISFDKPGTYTFEVVAIDRDLNYSSPASLTLTVVLPWYQNGWILYPSGGAIVVLLLLCSIFAYRYYHQRQQVLAHQREAVSELADAQKMQMGLIPQTAPEVPGLEIAGVCISARTVSGDFFDYVPLGNGMLAVVLADVTGKGMKGAMNAVLSSGALHSEAKFGVSPSQMLRALNRNLYPRFQQYTNCAMAILTIDPKGKTLKYANAGVPYPIIKRGEDDIEELSLNGLPLGAFKSSEYQETPPIELKSGNLIILFSDGITEAFGRDNPEQLYMETDRLADLIKGLDKTMNAEAVIDAIINDVRDFSGDAQQNDDMTIVVIKAL